MKGSSPISILPNLNSLTSSLLSRPKASTNAHFNSTICPFTQTRCLSSISSTRFNPSASNLINPSISVARKLASNQRKDASEQFRFHRNAFIQCRSYRHMAEARDSDNQSIPNRKPSPTSSPPSPSPPSTPNTSTTIASSRPSKQPQAQDPDDPLNLNTAPKTTVKEQRQADWSIIKKLLQHVWPRGDGATKRRVVLALALLIGGKVSRSREVGRNSGGGERHLPTSKARR